MTKTEDHKIDDYDYILSTVGNAYFSGITFSQLWEAVRISNTREQLDQAIAATILLKETVGDKKCLRGSKSKK